MATDAQTNANRKNAHLYPRLTVRLSTGAGKKSTGPKTIEGKKAISKNALKHGLFTNEAVIAGESIEDYNTMREKTLDELSPVGNMETILAERIVSLTWRLKRIERFQSIVIDAMIDKKLNSPYSNFAKKLVPAHLRMEPDDEGNIDSTLGKVIISDYSESRVLDRLSIYERRIENSLFKTINELRRTQILREMEKEKRETEEIIATDIEQGSQDSWQQDESISAQGFAATSDESGFAEMKYRKQSQFANLRLETLNSKHEILNNIEYPENQILETNAKS